MYTSKNRFLLNKPEIEIFVDVHVEERVQVDKVLVRVVLQGVFDDGTVQPLVQLRRTDGVVNVTLQPRRCQWHMRLQVH